LIEKFPESPFSKRAKKNFSMSSESKK